MEIDCLIDNIISSGGHLPDTLSVGCRKPHGTNSWKNKMIQEENTEGGKTQCLALASKEIKFSCM